jgi:putative peptide zinc metalloprotease protein
MIDVRERDVVIARLGDFQELDTSEAEQAHLLECYWGTHFRLSTMARTILEMRWSGAPFEEIADVLRADDVVNTSAASIAEYYSALHGRIAATEATRNKIDRNHLVRFEIFPEPLVRAIASVGKHGFDRVPSAFCIAVLLAGMTTWIVAIARGSHGVTPASLGVGYGLFLFSLVVHEFGHASASERFGGRPGAIGFTLYLTFPALYSDVSAAWRLKRWQRVLVDIGGSYFQLLVGSLYVVAFLITHWLPFHVAVLMIVGTTLFNLNPLFKFDGYWIVADALGVTNLSKQTMRIAGAARARFLGHVVDPLPWRTWTIAALSVYAVLSTAAWAYFLVRLGILIVKRTAWMVSRLPALRAEHFDGSLVFQFGLTLFSLAVSLFFLWRFGMRIAPQCMRMLRRFAAKRMEML